MSCVGFTCSECAMPDSYIKINEYQGQLCTQTGKGHTITLHTQNTEQYTVTEKHKVITDILLHGCFIMLPDSVVRQLIGYFLQLCPDCGNNFQPWRKILRVACKERGECVSMVRSVVLRLTQGIH